jgi:hypothetical protein
MRLITIVLGFVSLVGGNQLPWMFVGSAGFILGSFLSVGTQFDQSEWQIITVSTAIGMAGIFMTFYLQKLMVMVVGFLAGGYISLTLPGILGWKTPLVEWQAFLLVGAAFSLILFLWYNLALILVSTLAGTTVILQNMSFGTISKEALFVVLFIFGLIAQYVMMQYIPVPESE